MATTAVISLLLLSNSVKGYAYLFFGDNRIVSIKSFLEYLDKYKIAGELILAIVAYLFYLKSIILSFRSKEHFKALVFSEINRIKGKLLEMKVVKDFSTETIENYSNILFPLWVKDELFDNIEFRFVRLIIDLNFRDLSEGRRLFAFYFLMDLYPFSKAKLLAYIISIPLQKGNAKHEFLSLLQMAKNKLAAGKFDLNQQVDFLSITEAKKLQAEVASGNIVFYEESLKQKFSHEALLTVAEQLIKKGHTDISTLLKYRKRNNPIKMLIKYGENFYYWEQEQKNLIKQNVSQDSQEFALKKLKNILHPQPFSKALFNFKSELIQLLPTDPFLFLFDIDYIFKKHKIKTPYGFMQKKVIPSAKKHHIEMIRNIKKIDRSLSQAQKDFISNYYIIDMDIESVLIEADAKSTPEGLRRILVREVAQSGNFASMLSNNNIYVKEVIETLPPHSVLNIMGSEIKLIDFFKNYDKKIRSNLKTEDISIKNIYEIRKIGNKHNKCAKSLLGIVKNPDYNGPKISQTEMQTALKKLSEGAAKLEHLVEKGFNTERQLNVA
ncbi:hypothetical protein JWG44_10670 [Leptospira sp. 201903071]|uniref:hypothetical protein n=1 Tax=Leptospira ainazelensis TaxID=2810034 RepID=UPI00196298BE|nr:hypothetical protein [Leptospira ainazelensis]MBM9500709.1 hypothetical protein [Leptospira ainazelensis]